MIRRTPPPSEPWCVMGMVGYFGSPRAICVPESRIEFLQRYGWIVIARDSDNPLPTSRDLPPGQTYWPQAAQPVVRRVEMPDDNGANDRDED